MLAAGICVLSPARATRFRRIDEQIKTLAEGGANS
jgi:hypothetical protein